MKLWHDDIRKPPDGTWIWARTNEEAKKILEARDVTEASLDHDLGLHQIDPDLPDADLYAGDSEDDGYELVKWMCRTGHFPPVVAIHSWNPDGAKRMAGLLRAMGCRVTVKPYARPQPWEG